MSDATHLKAHRTAASLSKRGNVPRRIGRTKAGPVNTIEGGFSELAQRRKGGTSRVPATLGPLAERPTFSDGWSFAFLEPPVQFAVVVTVLENSNESAGAYRFCG